MHYSIQEAIFANCVGRFFQHLHCFSGGARLIAGYNAGEMKQIYGKSHHRFALCCANTCKDAGFSSR
jgi:hypothetical protein